jgi:hypothetical protein
VQRRWRGLGDGSRETHPNPTPAHKGRCVTAIPPRVARFCVRLTVYCTRRYFTYHPCRRERHIPRDASFLTPHPFITGRSAHSKLTAASAVAPGDRALIKAYIPQGAIPRRAGHRLHNDLALGSLRGLVPRSPLPRLFSQPTPLTNPPVTTSYLNHVRRTHQRHEGRRPRHRVAAWRRTLSPDVGTPLPCSPYASIQNMFLHRFNSPLSSSSDSISNLEELQRRETLRSAMETRGSPHIPRSFTAILM